MVKPERRRRIEQLYHATLARDPTDRGAFLREVCEGDDSVRTDVELLLAHASSAKDLITANALELADALPADAAPTLVGQKLGPYLIEALLGVGGMGEVYRARDTRLGRTVAVKVLPREKMVSPVSRHRFLQEARSISALNHPNIVILYDIACDRGTDFLVLEYVVGQTLQHMSAAGPMALADVLGYGVQIARALAAAHEKGIIHRDLKPANIIVTPESQVKVLDFGIAKLMEPVTAETQSETRGAETAWTIPGMVVGTVSYMSPEQARGEPLDARSDIFSLGCLLYEVSTGMLPFRGASVLSIMHEIATVNPSAPSVLRPDLPPEFDIVIECALAKEKGRRYGTAQQLADALQALQSRTQPAAPAPDEQQPEALVGRESELQKLQQILAASIRGSGRIVFLTGEPGIGKSALAEAFLFQARRDWPDLLIGRGACIEQVGVGEAYRPFLDALSGLLTGPGREHVIAILRRHAPTWCLQFPALFRAAGAFEQLQGEVIGATKERMLREFGDALAALASARPVVLQIEDLHWSDPPSVDLLRLLVPRAMEQRVLLIGTLRPEDVERRKHPIRNCVREMRAHNQCDEIRLPPLRPEHLVSYLDNHFAPNDFPAELPGLIYRKTEGHPLFSAALVQLLTERGDICRSNAHWTLGRPLAELDLGVPESVRGMIRQKIEILEDEDRRALQYASVQGKEFISTVLAHMTGADELALEQRLDRLGRVHRLIETHGEEELPDGQLATRYGFAHILYQNVLYDDVLSKQRVLLHRQTGELLVRHYGSQTPLVAGALALHFERGRDYSRAIDYLIQAADVAIERYAGAAAEEHYSNALQLVKKLPPAEQAHRAIVILYKRGTVRVAVGRLTEAERDFLAAIDQARATGDLVHECVSLNALANPFLSFTSLRADQLDRAERALRIAEQIDQPALRAEAMVNLALLHSVWGKPAVSKATFDAAVPIARSAGHPHALLRTLTYRGVGHFFQTEYPQAMQMLAEASDLAARLRDGPLLRSALFFLGWTRANLGQISGALAAWHELLEMSRRNGDRHFLARVPRRIAWIHRELQDFAYSPENDGAEPNDGMSSVEVDTVRLRASGAHTQADTAEYRLSQGDLTRASEEARALLDESTQHGTPKYVGIAHKILAEIAMTRGDLATAESELAEALQPFQTHPAPLITWKIYRLLGRLQMMKSDARAAQDAFSQGAETIQQIAFTITDEHLRSTFLNAPAVQEVLAQCRDQRALDG
jgi:serine/threonine protein kinase/tetratricopeptide (TPR) repeat protein